MHLKVNAIKTYKGPQGPNARVLALIDFEIEATLFLNQCALIEEDGRIFVAPPKPDRNRRQAVGWRHSDDFATTITAAGVAAYAALTGAAAI